MPSPFTPELIRQMERGALASGATTKLWPRPPLYLFAPDGGAERFTRLFRETWRRIPCWYRGSMLRHWRVAPEFPRYVLTPQVQLLECWGDTPRRSLRGVKAAVSEAGHRLKFRTRVVDAYPDDLVRDLIAHELAHVVQCATGGIELEGDDAGFWNEVGADELVDCWGFEPDAMDEWDRAHGVTRAIDTSGRSPERRGRVEVESGSRVFTGGRRGGPAWGVGRVGPWSKRSGRPG